MAGSSRAVKAQMFSEGDLGVLPPLGVYDPLGLIETRDMGRYEVMEIKHGRAAMLGFLHVIAVEAGAKIPIPDCEAAPTGLIASLEAVPTVGWLQIMLTMCMLETGVFGAKSQTGTFASKSEGEGEPGDIAGIPWVRYDDPEVRTFKLNAERQNGRAAMLGVTGCLIHELLGVDALYPTGGLGGAAPPTIVAALAVQGRSGSVQMFSEGDIGVLPPLGVYDPLGLIETRDMRRYEIMEGKHGRAAMLGFLHVIALKAGVVLPGALTLSGTKFSDIPTSCFGSLEAVPTFGWLQIMLFCLFQETGYGLGLAERQNGRAAMLGITGCLVHEILGVDALYPTGGLGGA